jgi:hypothetical protein
MADSECAIVMHENLERVGRFRTAAIEKDPAALERIKDALRRMLRAEEVESHAVEKRPGLKPN